MKALDDAKKATDRALAKADSLIAYFGFTQDRAWAYKSGKFAVIDRSGKRLTNFEFENPEPFKQSGYAIAQKADGFYYLIDKTGKVSEPYNYFFPCNNGWYKVKKGNLHTFYDKNYKQVEGWDWYERIENFQNNIAKIQKDGKWGCISPSGNVVTPILFDAIDFLDTNFAIVDVAGKEGIINKEGSYIIPPQFEDIYSYTGDCFAKAFFKNDGKYGVFDKNFNVMVSSRFDWIQGCTNDLLGFKQNDKFGILDKNGNIIVQPEYESIFSNDKNITWLLKDNKWGYIELV